MVDCLEVLADMEYPGRGLLAGWNSARELFVGNFMTGRSPSSQARRFSEGEDTRTIRTSVTDPEQLKRGSAALLLYPAIVPHEMTMVASNGAQTKLLYSALRRKLDALKRPTMHALSERILRDVLKEPVLEYDVGDDEWIDITTYEKDKNGIVTPRINFVAEYANACMHIVRRGAKGERVDSYYPFRAGDGGHGRLVCTYAGPNIKQPPSFEAGPHIIPFSWKSSKDMADDIYHALAPKDGGDDLRVAIATMRMDETGFTETTKWDRLKGYEHVEAAS